MRELLEQSRLPEGTEQLLEPGALPPEEEARILALALSRAGLPPVEKKERPIMKKRNFGLMLLAGVLCAGAVVGSAAAWFQMDRGLARAIGAGDEAPLGGNAIQTSATSDGWTLTVDQAVGDRNCAYLLLEVAAPEGTVLDADFYLMDDCRPVFEKDGSGSWGWNNLEDDDKTDNKVTFLLDMKMDSDLRSAKGVLKAKGIREVWFDPEDKGNDEINRLAEVSWEVPFRMEYQDTQVVYQPGQTVEVGQGSITVERVELTPLSAKIRLTGGGDILNRVEPVGSSAPGEGAVLLALKSRQGDIFLMDFVSYDIKEPLTGRAQTWEGVLTFRPIVDPADVTAVLLNGVEIPLE